MPKTLTGAELQVDDAPARESELFLVDGNNLAYRAFFALPEELATTEGFPTNALLGFTNMLFKLLADYRPRGVAVAWDTRPVHRAENLHWRATDVTRERRAALKGQAPAVIWLTGLSGSGKSTIANLLEARLHAEGRHTYLLDGDNVRHGLNRDLGFSQADRAENVRRVAETAKLMADAGLIVIVAFISPFRAERDAARALMTGGEFMEVHVDAPLAVAEARDPKGLYAKARTGEIKGFTGIDSPYEPPLKPEVRVDTAQQSPEDSVEHIMHALQKRRRG